MFSETKIALSAAMILSSAFPASAAHRVTHVHPAIYNMVPAAQSDQYPVLDVAPVCHGIASQSDLESGLRASDFDQCMKSEQSDREAMIKEWSTFSADDKRHCITETTMGDEASYTDLVTCMEMARDVRELHKQPNSLSEQNIPPAPVGHRQPTSR
jgi:hypothetical protein